MPASDRNEKRMEAFLALIRYAENGKQDRSDAYTRLFGGGHFGGFSDHPRKDVMKGHKKPSASGAYGILKGTYDEAVTAHAAHDFYPRSQEAIAVWLITHKGHGA